ncbi:hypothetical protein ACSFA0_14730 [Variovorax sp. LT1P1]|uniref:hypothetical protein n=1 Tax=Variovorax sp. LT1P1 TaxID=3443730 RepID=UPI003F45F5EA
MSSLSPTIQEIKKLDRINATIVDFLKHPIWSIAAGSMLISGIQTSATATKIPDESSQIADPTLPASSRQLHSARSVLEAWYESYEEDDGSRASVPIEETPFKFLSWCEHEFLGSLCPPDLLAHFFCLAGLRAAGPVPHDLVARLLELEQHDAVERDRLRSVEEAKSSSHADRLKLGRFVKRTEILLQNGKITSPIAMEIAVALDSASSIGTPTPLRVWGHLLTMAESGEFPLLKRTGPKTLAIPSGQRDWQPYTQQALGQFLRRNMQRLLGKQSNQVET